MGEGKGRHLDTLMAILQKVAPGNMMAMVGPLDIKEVRPLQAMEDGLHQGRHLRLEDMEDSPLGLRRHLEDIEDSLLGLHRRLEVTGEGPHLPDTEEDRHHLNRQCQELTVKTLCQAETTRILGKKPHQTKNQHNRTEMSLLHRCRSTILVTAR